MSHYGNYVKEICNRILFNRSRKTVNTNPDVFFPDEVVVEIIIRLPAKTALLCRCVCRKWRDLTWSRHFLDLYLRRGAPMILSGTSCSKLVLFDYRWTIARPMTSFRKFCIVSPSTREFDINPLLGMLFSDRRYDPEYHTDGIIVLREHSSSFSISFILHNPIYGEYVRICLAKELIGCEIHGVFFHPSLNEYCTLWRIPASVQGNPKEVDYRMLNMGPNPCWRRIRNPWNDKDVIGFPLYVDGYLYWMVEHKHHFEIVELNIKTEVFTKIPHTVPETVEWKNIVKLKVHSLLSLVSVSAIEKMVHVNVWTLQDRAEKSWKNSTYIISCGVYPELEILVPVAIWDGELYLKVDERRYVCNLKMGTGILVPVAITRVHEMENDLLFFYPHAMSLDSLRNCKSNICMNNQGLEPERVATNSFIPRYVLSSDDRDDGGSFSGTKKSLLDETEEENE